MPSLTQSCFSGPSETEIIRRTIGDYLDEICQRYPDNEALVVRHQGVRWTTANSSARSTAWPPACWPSV